MDEDIDGSVDSSVDGIVDGIENTNIFDTLSSDESIENQTVNNTV
jgi:hypothetical protein